MSELAASPSGRLEHAVAEAMELYSGKRVLIGLSGGADSTALTAALARLSGFLNITINCVHINHGLRPPLELADDLASVRSLCYRYKLPLRVATVPRGLIPRLAGVWGGGVEDAARRVRRRIWRHELDRSGAIVVALGHNADDQLENILIRVLRGAGPAGLSLWRPSRGKLVRPLLKINRAEIVSYLSSHKLAYRDDSTNSQTIYLRNRVRLRLIPLLDKEFPAWRSGLTLFGETQSELAQHLKAEARRRVAWRREGWGLASAEAAFETLDPIVRVEAIFQAINLLESKKYRKRTIALSADRPVKFRPPSRKVLNNFVQGQLVSADLGRFRLSRFKNDSIHIDRVSRGLKEGGHWRAFYHPGRFHAFGLRFKIAERAELMANSSPQERLGLSAWPVSLPCALWARSKKALFHDTELAVSLEDERGLVAVFKRGQASPPSAKKKAGKGTGLEDNAAAGYARSNFFFILIKES